MQKAKNTVAASDTNVGIDETAALRSKITKSSITILLFALLSAPLGYFIRMLLSRSLSQEMFGLFYAVMAVFTLLSTYNDLGFGYSVTYFIPKFKKRKQLAKLWNTFLYNLVIETGTAIILSVILLFSTNWIAENYFQDLTAVPLLRLGIIFFISHSLTSAFKKFFIGMEIERVYSSIDLIYYTIVLLGTSVLYFFTDASVTTYFLIWTLGYLLTAFIIALNFVVNFSDLFNRAKWDQELFNVMLTYSIPTLLTTTVGTIVRSADVFFLTLFTGLTAVGGYNVILPIVNIPQIILSPINTSFYPLISGVSDKSSVQVTQIVEKIFKIVPLIAFYFCFFIFLFPEALVQTLFGSKWMSFTALPLRIFSIGYIILLTENFINVVVSGLGLVKERLYFSTVSVVLTIIIGFTLIKNFGLTGAAFGTLIVYLYNLFFKSILIHSQVSFKLPYKFYLQLLLLALIIFLILTILNISIHGIVEILIAGMIYTFVFIGYILLDIDLRNDIKLTLISLLKSN